MCHMFVWPGQPLALHREAAASEACPPSACSIACVIVAVAAASIIYYGADKNACVTSIVSWNLCLALCLEIVMCLEIAMLSWNSGDSLTFIILMSWNHVVVLKHMNSTHLKLRCLLFWTKSWQSNQCITAAHVRIFGSSLNKIACFALQREHGTSQRPGPGPGFEWKALAHRIACCFAGDNEYFGWMSSDPPSSRQEGVRLWQP